jgi:hypothetical protein
MIRYMLFVDRHRSTTQRIEEVADASPQTIEGDCQCTCNVARYKQGWGVHKAAVRDKVMAGRRAVDGSTWRRQEAYRVGFSNSLQLWPLHQEAWSWLTLSSEWRGVCNSDLPKCGRNLPGARHYSWSLPTVTKTCCSGHSAVLAKVVGGHFVMSIMRESALQRDIPRDLRQGLSLHGGLRGKLRAIRVLSSPDTPKRVVGSGWPLTLYLSGWGEFTHSLFEISTRVVVIDTLSSIKQKFWLRVHKWTYLQTFQWDSPKVAGINSGSMWFNSPFLAFGNTGSRASW